MCTTILRDGRAQCAVCVYNNMRYITRWLCAVCRHRNITCDCGGIAAAMEDSSGRAVHLVEQQHHNYSNTQRSCAGRRRRRRV